MHARRLLNQDEDLNPHIALADLALALVLVLAFFLAASSALGSIGWEKVRYQEAQAAFKKAVDQEFLGDPHAPRVNPGKNDPPGSQRWVVAEAGDFALGVAEPQRKETLIRFASIVGREEHRRRWRRIRIEGHTQPQLPGKPDDWELSCARAAAVARIFERDGHIQPYFMTASGRAGQDPIHPHTTDPVNERVEILLEYAGRAASPAVEGPR